MAVTVVKCLYGFKNRYFILLRFFSQPRLERSDSKGGCLRCSAMNPYQSAVAINLYRVGVVK